ncbi:MAG: SDR family NAD(P)-dependent oxidoreductase [Bacteroidetes bacterium]|nr:SDR family NAD(P)-dependent oxidoreductase [Bacteroidota bacterium]
MKKTILITGATSGFGKAIAQLFAIHGHHLIITGRRSDRLDKLKNELDNQASSVTTLCFDVRDKVAVKEAITSIQDRTIDILVNNAGLASGLSPIDEGNISDWDLMIDTNIKGLLYMTKETLPLLRNSTTPHIFNIGSTAGKTAYKNGNVYCATKFAVDAISQSMRIDLLPYGVKVTAINPGMAETEFSVVRFKGDKERAKKVYQDIQPLRAEDIANVVLFCATLPEHVCINDLTLTCTSQANAIYTIRDSEKPKQL